MKININDFDQFDDLDDLPKKEKIKKKKKKTDIDTNKKDSYIKKEGKDIDVLF